MVAKMNKLAPLPLIDANTSFASTRDATIVSFNVNGVT